MSGTYVYWNFALAKLQKLSNIKIIVSANKKKAPAKAETFLSSIN